MIFRNPQTIQGTFCCELVSFENCLAEEKKDILSERKEGGRGERGKGKGSGLFGREKGVMLCEFVVGDCIGISFSWLFLTVDHQCFSQPFRIMCLKDIQHLYSLARLWGFQCAFIIDQHGQSVLTGPHQVNTPLEPKHNMLHLLVVARCVLQCRSQIYTWPRSHVPAHDDQLTRGILG